MILNLNYTRLAVFVKWNPAGLLSGSVGLINDAADTLLDGLASGSVPSQYG